VVICNSNVHHELIAGEYKARREQCEAAVRHFQRTNPGVKLLRDVTPALLEETRAGMDGLVYRRARHVVGEIGRVGEFAGGLERGDYAGCGELMYASHASLRDDYEVSCGELDALVEIARGVPGVYGARMTGGGFGGCIVALCRPAAVEGLSAAIEREYPPRAGGRQASTFATTASRGAHLEPVV
jgi:galactokinase